MALTSIANLVESISSQLFGQGKETPQGGQATGTTNNSALASFTQDRFTPSNQINSPQAAEQEAGLFQVSQLALFAVAADSLASRIAQPQANQNFAAPPAVPAAAANAGEAPPAATANLNALATETSQSSTAPVVQTAPPANTLGQIQAFNQALTALGLTNNDIQKLDQIATLVNDFSPTAFNDLIRQFQVLARQASQLTAEKASANTAGNPAAYQVQELAIQFAAPQQSFNAAATQGGLQLGRVQLTLINGAGQSANVQAAQPKYGAAAAG